MEWLIAATIIASASALLVGGLVAANRSAEFRQEQALLTQCLATRLALLDEALAPGAPQTGTCFQPPDAVRWVLTSAEAPPPLAPLLQATITATRPNGHRAEIVTCRRPATVK